MQLVLLVTPGLIPHCLGLAVLAKLKGHAADTIQRVFDKAGSFRRISSDSRRTSTSRPFEGILKVFITSVSRQSCAVTNGRDLEQCRDKDHKIGYMPQ